MSDWEKGHKMIKEAQLLCKVFFKGLILQLLSPLKGTAWDLREVFISVCTMRPVNNA